MNREIKFRAYHHLTKKIINPEEVSSKTLGKNPIEWHNERKWTLMQYTGLKDQNGKEIYEGDILKASNSIIKIVFKGRGYEGIYLNKEEMNELPIQNNNYLYWQIIGNIYENPEFTQSSE